MTSSGGGRGRHKKGECQVDRTLSTTLFPLGSRDTHGGSLRLDPLSPRKLSDGNYTSPFRSRSDATHDNHPPGPDVRHALPLRPLPSSDLSWASSRLCLPLRLPFLPLLHPGVGNSPRPRREVLVHCVSESLVSDERDGRTQGPPFTSG